MEVITYTYSTEETLATFVWLCDRAKESVFLSIPCFLTKFALPFTELLPSGSQPGTLGRLLQRLVQKKVHLHLLAESADSDFPLTYHRIEPFGKPLRNEMSFWPKMLASYATSLGLNVDFQIPRYNLSYLVIDDKLMMVGPLLQPTRGHHSTLKTSSAEVCVVFKPTVTLCDFVRENYDKDGASRRVEKLFTAGRHDLQPRDASFDNFHTQLLRLIERTEHRLIVFTEFFNSHKFTKNEITGALVHKIAEKIRANAPFECVIITNTDLFGQWQVHWSSKEYNLTAQHFEDCFIQEQIQVTEEEEAQRQVRCRLFLGSLKTPSEYMYWKGTIIQGDGECLFSSGALTDSGLELVDCSQFVVQLHQPPDWNTLLGGEPVPEKLHRGEGKKCSGNRKCGDSIMSWLKSIYSVKKMMVGDAYV